MGGCFPADVYQVVFDALGGQQPGNLIHPIAFGDGAEVELDAGLGLLQQGIPAVDQEFNLVKADELEYFLHFGAIGLFHGFFRRIAKTPIIDQRHDRRVKITLGLRIDFFGFEEVGQEVAVGISASLPVVGVRAQI